MYRFFVQPQINQDDHRVFGYEVLLRKQEDDNWILPRHFTDISVADQAKLLEETAASLKTAVNNQVLAFNLNNQQLRHPLTLGTIIALKKRIAPAALTIELTEAPTLEEMKQFSLAVHQYGIGLVLDDVGTGSNTYQNVRDLLPFVDEIKFAMQNLRMSGEGDLIPASLAFWAQIAREYRLRLILEGVENADDQALAKQYGITLHQGYLYGKPSLV
ncbi:EAL domain-containing protein [Levilactobacillus suantsaiihabitans]|uniref:EAL domain-containing protein n=1 Tax=Levilactobacillus suantsaiihabitans TaxID=2487722 RepID=A0A4Z0J7D3_9LACO|nr:EAL domain-containing protein [Levilactobacillus suantsaiihabitans]TGD18477.1 EAL domain-containing protein [Levilactobacillus suantsaiihabitans]